MTNPTLQSIWRFPVKGFPGQTLSSTDLIKGAGIPGDRRYAITNGTVDSGEWMPARSFFINAVNDGMMKHKLSFKNNCIVLENTRGKKITIAPDDTEKLEGANAQIAEFMEPVGVSDDLPPPKIIDRVAHSNWDYVDTPISIINMETVRQVGTAIGAKLDPARFRGNLIVDGLPAWHEFNWMGKRIQVGDCILEVHRPIDRCPTPGVNPKTGERDVEVAKGLQEHFGHVFCGVYANVVESGKVNSGDALNLMGDGTLPLEELMVSNASPYPLWPRVAKITTCQIESEATRLSLTNATQWPLPEPKPGQRVRFHLGPDACTAEYIKAISPAHYHFEIEKSATDDPVTEHLRTGLTQGDEIVISGPFGRVDNG